MAEKKFVDANGVKVIKDDYKKRIEDQGTAIDGKLKSKAESSALNALQTTVETDYLKSADADGKYAGKSIESTVENLATKSNKVWFMSEDAVKTKEDLATLKDTASVGECFIISDDNNHLYVYLGAETSGVDENGFLDTQTHVDLTDYLKSEDANGKFALQTTVQSIQESINSLGDTYYTEQEVDAKFEGLGDTYYTETEIDQKLGALDTVSALSDSEIQEILQDSGE